MVDLASPGAFRWVYDETPMSSLYSLLAAEVLYFAVIYGLQWALSGKPAASRDASKKDSDGLFKLGLCVHNAILCLLSAVMFAGAAYEAYVRSSREGYEWLFCEKPGAKAQGGVYYWSYIYYLSKFLEFGDTVFKVVKRKPLDFLHVYHHSLVALMCWTWLHYAQSLQTMGLLFNTMIHVFMYYYYALTVYYPPPWWKRFITKGQIVQFQSSFMLSLPFIYLHVTRAFVHGGEGCQGWNSFLFNAAFNLSLLFLFIRFSRRTYTSKKAQ